MKETTFISFIASQGPTARTSVHHLQMILDYSIDIVVVLTPIFIDDMERCHQYWPNDEDDSKIFGHITVTKLSEEKLRKETFKRHLQLESNAKGVTDANTLIGSNHQFIQFHYT